MDRYQNAAGSLLEYELGLLWPIGYAAWRFLAIPRMAEASDDTPISITDEVERGPSEAKVRGNFVFLCVTGMCLWFFVIGAAGDIVDVMGANPAWGVLAALIGVGMIAMIAATEWLHHQNGRYTDLISDADANKARESTDRYQRVVKALRLGGVVWLGLFVLGTFWLWRLSRIE